MYALFFYCPRGAEGLAFTLFVAHVGPEGLAEGLPFSLFCARRAEGLAEGLAFTRLWPNLRKLAKKAWPMCCSNSKVHVFLAFC